MHKCDKYYKPNTRHNVQTIDFFFVWKAMSAMITIVSSIAFTPGIPRLKHNTQSFYQGSYTVSPNKFQDFSRTFPGPKVMNRKQIFIETVRFKLYLGFWHLRK